MLPLIVPELLNLKQVSRKKSLPRAEISKSFAIISGQLRNYYVLKFSRAPKTPSEDTKMPACIKLAILI
jgi:hypothetical protein